MRLKLFRGLFKSIAKWMTHEFPPPSVPLCDFERLSYEVRTCDVLLVEGRSRVSELIKTVTQSPWSHSMLYLGRLHDIQDPSIRARIKAYYNADPHEQLVLESMLGQGTIITPLDRYKRDHLRICRPKSISRNDSQRVIHYSVRHLGVDYDIRQLMDLFRLMMPWAIVPRRWRSSLFYHDPGPTTRMICSTIIAKAFGNVRFPILPAIKPHDEMGMQLIARNPRLITPKDFDYSPYFEIIKYPFIHIEDHLPSYRNLPWAKEDIYSTHDEIETFCPLPLAEQEGIEESILLEEKSHQESFPSNKGHTLKNTGIFNLLRKRIQAAKPELSNDLSTAPLPPDFDTDNETADPSHLGDEPFAKNKKKLEETSD